MCEHANNIKKTKQTVGELDLKGFFFSFEANKHTCSKDVPLVWISTRRSTVLFAYFLEQYGSFGIFHRSG